MLDVETFDTQWVGFARGWPGCFSSGRTREECLAHAPQAVADYRDWVAARGGPVPDLDEPGLTELGEVHLSWLSAPDNDVCAFFAADRPPLSAEELQYGLQLLRWSRDDLLAAIDGLTTEELARPLEDGWSIARVLSHIGGSEWYYLDRLDLAFPRDAVPDDPAERLRMVRAHLERVLPGLADDDRLAEKRFEIWSPRKVLRRAACHERDHTAHIRRLRTLL
jgi:predicted RNase H-like HicB family nuclease